MADDFESFFPSAPDVEGAPLPEIGGNGDDEQSERDAFSRLSMTGKQSQERLEVKKKEIQMKECPFKPTINALPSAVHRPNDVFNSLFIQAKSQEHKREKLRQTVEQKQNSQNVFSPEINKNTSRERRDQSLACNQLYQHAMNQMKEKAKFSRDVSHVDEECSFTPVLNPRSMKIEKKAPSVLSRSVLTKEEAEEIEAERKQIKSTLEMTGCTFEPSTNKRDKKRTAKEVSEELYQMSKKKQEKLKKLRKEQEINDAKRYNHHPKVSSSYKQTMGQRGVNVFTRLSIVKASPQISNIHNDEDELTFKPKTISRGKGYGTDRLYQKGVESMKKRRDPASNQFDSSMKADVQKLTA